ncbi:MAG: gas vesicle protein [Blastocatellia bacterium]|nr:gas vesicle protein [Blastocatellia bacterium]
MSLTKQMTHNTQSSSLADILERVLDKGIVVAGDIKIKLVDIELLTIQIRLVVCSVDKAKEIGLDWWTNNPSFNLSNPPQQLPEANTEIEKRLERIESLLTIR